MKFLFFDIECSNCFGKKPKMCEFGYVLTDEHFNVLRKEDIPMSPGRKNRQNMFDLRIYKREPGFQWAYGFDTYFESPEFPEYYDAIRKLFMEDDVMVFGYAVNNDVLHLNYAVRRYGLEKLAYDAYDIQKMVQFYFKKAERFMGLKNAFKALCSVSELMNLQEHLSRDDAFMSMRVFQKMCENLKLTPLEMIELCDGCKFNSEECRYHFSSGTPKRSRHWNRANQVVWGDFYRENQPVLERESSIGRIVSVTGKLKESGEALKMAIALIKEKNMVPYDRLTGSDYLIAFDEDDAAQMKEIMKYPYAGKIVTLKEFRMIKA